MLLLLYPIVFEFGYNLFMYINFIFLVYSSTVLQVLSNVYQHPLPTTTIEIKNPPYIPVPLYSQSLPPFQPLETNDLFVVPIVLLFLEGHINGIIM